MEWEVKYSGGSGWKDESDNGYRGGGTWNEKMDENEEMDGMER